MWSGEKWSEEGKGNTLGRYKKEVSVIRTQRGGGGNSRRDIIEKKK